MINIVYKMASAVIANRLKSALDELIHENLELSRFLSREGS